MQIFTDTQSTLAALKHVPYTIISNPYMHCLKIVLVYFPFSLKYVLSGMMSAVSVSYHIQGLNSSIDLIFNPL